MALSNYRLRAAVLAAPLAVGLALAGATAAHATYENDPRATEHVYDDNAKTCADASLGGEVIAEVDGEGGDDSSNFVISPDENEGGDLNEDQYLSILGVKPGVTVTGIVVKGGNGYNVYIPGEKELSENPPWMKLYAPLNDGGNIPQISHWYACGEVEEQPTSTPTTPTTPPTTSETSTTQPSETSTSPEEPSESSTPASSTSSVADATTTTEAPIDNASDEGDLATTGFGGSWLVWAGALFVLIGVASFAGMRVLKRN